MANRKKNPLLRGIRHRLTPWAAQKASKLFCLLPFDIAQAIGSRIGSALWWLAPRARRTLQHVQLAYPEKTPAEQRQIARESFRSMGEVLAEGCYAPGFTPDFIRKRVRFNDPELAVRLMEMAKGRGLIVLAGHFGAWEMALHGFSVLYGTPMMTVGARPSIEAMADVIKAMREAHGGKLVWRGEAGLSVVRHLRRGGPLALLVDHNLKEEGVQVPFFGRPAHTALAPARLALQTGAVVTTVFPLRVSRGHFVLHLGPPFDIPPAAKDPEQRRPQEIELTAAYTRRIEQAIRENPGQWMWMHRRWQERRKDSLPWPG